MQANRDNPGSGKEEGKTKLHILIVEDERGQLLVLKKVLTRLFPASEYDFVMDVAENGKIAIEMADKQKYDFIIMDDQMPVMKGSEACPIIKKQSAYNSETPIFTHSTTHGLLFEGSVHKLAKPNKFETLRDDVEFNKIVKQIVDDKKSSVSKTQETGDQLADPGADVKETAEADVRENIADDIADPGGNIKGSGNADKSKTTADEAKEVEDKIQAKGPSLRSMFAAMKTHDPQPAVKEDHPKNYGPKKPGTPPK